MLIRRPCVWDHCAVNHFYMNFKSMVLTMINVSLFEPAVKVPLTNECSTQGYDQQVVDKGLEMINT